MNLDISNYEAMFDAYAQSFCEKEKKHRAMLELKIFHTHAVLAHMRKLIKEPMLAPLGRTCLLAALFHDVARFSQFARWGTFKDNKSTNHGHLGVRVLKELGWLKAEDDQARKIIYSAINMHNRFSLPKGLARDTELVTLAVRDADKLDILRIMSEQFMLGDTKDSAVIFYAKDEPDLYSKNIIKAVFEKRLASYNDIVYVNDFKILLGTWLHELHFNSTKKILASSGYLELILSDVPMAEEVQEAKRYLLKLLNNLV